MVYRVPHIKFGEVPNTSFLATTVIIVLFLGLLLWGFYGEHK